MDYGHANGNCFQIPYFPDLTSALLLYLYLSFNPDARSELLDMANQVRATRWDCVWAEHPALLFPIPIEAHTTDEDLQQYLCIRIPFHPQNQHHH
jgi:hypothetical protein